ncbi:uncharacterized protein LOC124936345 [Impatiens glandulifera]|uniref:uncharacterized protein LOC124936345 n=1 Tax=Impatiens glandulifera TaxID=253017 RepID=UPI001FB07751|nr:uncharacterized protein LOC124936345 [Impatiens glandulifera]
MEVSIADETIEELLRCIRPTMDSEEKRRDVFEYIQKLVKTSLGHEVFPYGSGPLKTYLPDGDIDLTVVSNPDRKNTLPDDVHALLLAEEAKENSEFKVKSILFIDAEVKIVKCIVQDILVDISFNQLGGLSTLCFLEEVDSVIGKDHLFKRSIILIKAWCQHESRVLGANYGLISTYALETLVLYIFHVSNRSLNQPLEVLYRFLDYFSKFNWDRYGVSLEGPILKATLPSIVAEKPVDWGNDFLFQEDFFKDCADYFTFTSSSLDVNLKEFPRRFLNIVDPLKESNNIGRSISKGNSHRIRSAFMLGAQTLEKILELPSDKVAQKLKKFFSTTFRRHGHRLCPFSTSSISEDIDWMEDFDSDEEVMEVTYLPVHMSCRISSVQYSSPSAENSKSESSALSEGQSSSTSNENLGSTLLIEDPCEEQSDDDLSSTDSVLSDLSSTYSVMSDLSSALSETYLESLNPLVDLAGEFDTQIRNLLCGKNRLENGMNRLENGMNRLENRINRLENGMNRLENGMNPLGWVLPPYPLQLPFQQNFIPMNSVYGFEGRVGTQPFFPRQNVSSYNRSVHSRWRNRKHNNHSLETPRKLKNDNNFASVRPPERRYGSGFYHSEGTSSNTTFPTAPPLTNIVFGSLGNPPVINTTRRPPPAKIEKRNPRVPLSSNDPRREMERPALLNKEDFPPLTN